MNLKSEISNFRCFEEYAKVRAANLPLTDHFNSKAPFVWSGIKQNAEMMNNAAFHTYLLDLGIVSGLTEVESNNIKADLQYLHAEAEAEAEEKNAEAEKKKAEAEERKAEAEERKAEAEERKAEAEERKAERDFELQKLILEQKKEKKSDVPIQEKMNWKNVCKYAIFLIFLKIFSKFRVH